MNSERNILIAFILNLVFSFFEFFGGIFTGSVAIISDALHDIGDATSIGISYFFEKKSKRTPDDDYTYGYLRYSVMGSVITTLILLFGSVAVIFNAIQKIISPTEINYNGMLIFAIIGVVVNLGAALITRHGDSLNQKAVNLHMLEDVLGWIVVLVGAIVMRFTNLTVIDPLMSIGVAVFILIHTLKNLRETLDIFLERTPRGISVEEIKQHLCKTEGVVDVHHIHIWSMNGQSNYATMHIVADGDAHSIKNEIRKKLTEHNIVHATLELETTEEHCHEKSCYIETKQNNGHHHHSHHHHH